MQHVAAFKHNLEQVRVLVSASRALSGESGSDDSSSAAQPASLATAAKAAAEEQCFRAVVDLREAARQLNDHNWESSLAFLDKAAECEKALFVHSQKLLRCGKTSHRRVHLFASTCGHILAAMHMQIVLSISTPS